MLSSLTFDDAVHARVSSLCIAGHVDGLRADLVMLRAARALAAFEQAQTVSVEHVERVSESVLVHRRKEGKPPGARGEQGAHPQTDERTGDSDESTFGYMPPEPVDITRVKNVRPLSSKKS